MPDDSAGGGGRQGYRDLGNVRRANRLVPCPALRGCFAGIVSQQQPREDRERIGLSEPTPPWPRPVRGVRRRDKVGTC
ncbi:MAG: hypothetical protein U0836_24045 [Pirellulales bacterium]